MVKVKHNKKQAVHLVNTTSAVEKMRSIIEEYNKPLLEARKQFEEFAKYINEATKPIERFSKQIGEITKPISAIGAIVESQKEYQKMLSNLANSFKAPTLLTGITGLKGSDLTRTILGGAHISEYLTNQDKEDIIEYTVEKVDEKIEGKDVVSEVNNQVLTPTFPLDLKWDEISITFLNPHDVEIQFRNHKHITTYAKMGFKDKRTGNVNKQWQLIQLLSMKNGELDWNNQNANLLIKKRKQMTADTLKKYFKIKEDPFFDYRKEGLYRIKIQLIPEKKGFR